MYKSGESEVFSSSASSFEESTSLKNKAMNAFLALKKDDVVTFRALIKDPRILSCYLENNNNAIVIRADKKAEENEIINASWLEEAFMHKASECFIAIVDLFDGDGLRSDEYLESISGFLCSAILDKQNSLINKLLINGADPNWHCNVENLYAAEEIPQEHPIFKRDMNALELALYNEDEALIIALLENGAHIFTLKGKTYSHDAVPYDFAKEWQLERMLIACWLNYATKIIEASYSDLFMLITLFNEKDALNLERESLVKYSSELFQWKCSQEVATHILGRAVFYENMEFTQFCLRKGADVKMTAAFVGYGLPVHFANTFFSPLSWALVRNNANMVALLLFFGADIATKQPKEAYSPKEFAKRYQREACLEQGLVKAHAMFAQIGMPHTLPALSVKLTLEDNLQLVKEKKPVSQDWLISMKDCSNPEKGRLLHQALLVENESVIKTLIHSCDQIKPDFIRKLVTENCLNSIKILVNEGQNKLCIHYGIRQAIEEKNKGIVTYLFSVADCDQIKNTLEDGSANDWYLDFCIETGTEFDALLECCIKKNEGDRAIQIMKKEFLSLTVSPLHLAVNSGHINLIWKLLFNGASEEKRIFRYGSEEKMLTPLEYAKFHYSTENRYGPFVFAFEKYQKVKNLLNNANNEIIDGTIIDQSKPIGHVQALMCAYKHLPFGKGSKKGYAKKVLSDIDNKSVTNENLKAYIQEHKENFNNKEKKDPVGGYEALLEYILSEYFDERFSALKVNKVDKAESLILKEIDRLFSIQQESLAGKALQELILYVRKDPSELQPFFIAWYAKHKISLNQDPNSEPTVSSLGMYSGNAETKTIECLKKVKVILGLDVVLGKVEARCVTITTTTTQPQ